MEQSKQLSNEFLGKEKVGRLLKMFSIPCVISLVIQALYNLVDQVFIGHKDTLGAIGNAATGIVFPLTVIALGIGLWLGDGAAACISINQGKGNSKDSSKCVGTVISLGVVVGVILTVICLLFNESILKAIGASGDILEFSKEYSIFIILGFTFFILTSVVNPVIRADGNPKYAMLCLIIGSVVNIILDPLFIYVFDMGMNGAALATFIGQATAFGMNIAYLFRSKTFKLSFKDLLPSFKLMKPILKLGISSFLIQFAILVISIINNILLLKYSESSGYDVTITQGVLTLSSKVFGIVVSIIVGIALGGQPILGYNFGAKKYDRVKETYKLILKAVFCVGIIFTLLFELVPQLFLYIFGTGGENVDPVAYKEFTILTFRIYLGFILFTCMIKASSIFFQAIGRPYVSAFVAICRDMIFLIPASIITIHLGGVKAFLWSAPITDTLTLIVSLIFTVSTFKRLDKMKLELNNNEMLINN